MLFCGTLAQIIVYLEIAGLDRFIVTNPSFQVFVIVYIDDSPNSPDITVAYKSLLTRDFQIYDDYRCSIAKWHSFVNQEITIMNGRNQSTKKH